MLLHSSHFHSFVLKLSNHPRWNDPKDQRLSPCTLSSFLLYWVLLAVLTLPRSVHCRTYKLGVVGPWACDPLFAKALPKAAAQLAVDRIRKDSSLDLGTRFDYVILNEDCQTSKALSAFLRFSELATGFVGPTNSGYCDAASFLGKNWDRVIFSWACVNHELDDTSSHPTFVRTLPSPTRVLLSVMKYFRWAHVAIISSDQDIWVDTAGKLAAALRSQGLPVGAVLSMGREPKTVRQALRKIREVDKLRIIIMCMHSVLIGGEEQGQLLEAAHDLQMTEGGIVFVPYDALLYSLPYKNTPYPVLVNNSKLQKAYDAVLTITMDSKQLSFRQALQESVRRRELETSIKPEQVSPLFGTIYNAVYLVAKALDNNRKHRAWSSGANIAKYSRNVEFNGFNQRIWTDRQGLVHSDYVILDMDGNGNELHCSHVLDLGADLMRFTGRAIHYPNGDAPRSDPACWFNRGRICNGGVDPLMVLAVSLGIVLGALISIVLAYFIRRRVIQLRLVRGPNKILLTMDDVTFINPQLSKKKLSFEDSRIGDGRMSFSEARSAKSAALSSSLKSLTPATYENSNVAIYEGDWVWLKKFPYGDFRRIKPGTTAVFELMKDLRQENVNLFLGFFYDCGLLAIVTEFCTRGSLQDLLSNQDVKLDWMFKSSLLLDLIKGMKYLHHRDYVHGRLKSRNCVVDGRFVLKVTDYGYMEVVEAQRVPLAEPKVEDFLWTAPEILRKLNPFHNGTKKGDVYSFSIIMQEVVVRGPPYCMFDLTVEDIIQKVKKPPPVFRPNINPDHAPPECIQLMRHCWTEVPERRYNFEEIFDQDSACQEAVQWSVSESLKLGNTVEPEHFDQVSLYFSDIVGFTTISANSEPIEVVDLLNDLYTLFDAVLDNHDVYKVETIGDAYMVASGLPTRNGNRHTAEIANMSLDILSAVGTFKMRHMPDVPVRIRIGLHSGPCVAGVVGLTMPRYCLFGDTVTTASRMESSGFPYRIQVNQSTVKILQDLNEGYRLQLRGRAELKGKAIEETYWLVGKDGFTKPLPVPPQYKPGQTAHGLQLEEMAPYRKKRAQKLQKGKNEP
eukprot:gi/632936239/ref/XP_007893106.1/ PREDICTED: retinal guanylyl cyclase 2 [Callorhinchus milii]